MIISSVIKYLDSDCFCGRLFAIQLARDSVALQLQI